MPPGTLEVPLLFYADFDFTPSLLDPTNFSSINIVFKMEVGLGTLRLGLGTSPSTSLTSAAA